MGKGGGKGISVDGERDEVGSSRARLGEDRVVYMVYGIDWVVMAFMSMMATLWDSSHTFHCRSSGPVMDL